MIKKEDLYIYLKQLEEDNGILTPQAVVEYAKPEESPIHDRFEWEDSVAANKYRLQQARELIQEVKVEWHGKETREFFNVIVTTNDVQERGYVSLERVLSNKDLHVQVVKEALRELKYWQQKYKTLSEFENIISEDKLKKIEESL